MQQCQRSSWYILQRNFHLWRPPQSKGTLLCVSRCVHVRLPGPLGPAPVIIFGANPCGPTVGHGIKIWNGVRCQWMLMPRNLSSWCWSTHLPTPFLSCSTALCPVLPPPSAPCAGGSLKVHRSGHLVPVRSSLLRFATARICLEPLEYCFQLCFSHV